MFFFQAKKTVAAEDVTEDVAPGEDANPATAKLPPIEIGDTLPSIVLKNEKDEDVDVQSLTTEKGLVLFLVPKADTRSLTFSPHYLLFEVLM
jgi:peroxiredoxin Q/BCP